MHITLLIDQDADDLLFQAAFGGIGKPLGSFCRLSIEAHNKNEINRLRRAQDPAPVLPSMSGGQGGVGVVRYAGSVNPALLDQHIRRQRNLSPGEALLPLVPSVDARCHFVKGMGLLLSNNPVNGGRAVPDRSPIRNPR